MALRMDRSVDRPHDRPRGVVTLPARVQALERHERGNNARAREGPEDGAECLREIHGARLSQGTTLGLTVTIVPRPAEPMAVGSEETQHHSVDHRRRSCPCPPVGPSCRHPADRTRPAQESVRPIGPGCSFSNPNTVPIRGVCGGRVQGIGEGGVTRSTHTRTRRNRLHGCSVVGRGSGRHNPRRVMMNWWWWLGDKWRWNGKLRTQPGRSRGRGNEGDTQETDCVRVP